MNKKATQSKTVNPDEINRFSALAETWWNPSGPMAPLHKLNPVRLDYIKSKISAHFNGKQNVRLLDMGCAAGLVSEPLAAWGAKVTGVDASEKLIAAAQQHAAENNVNVTYRHCDIDALVKEGKTFDVVLALEIIEHVDEQKHFVASAVKLLNKNGLLIFSTLNRSAKGFMLGIIGAEYILRWLPRGTHDWRQFVKPSELAAWLEACNMQVSEVTGLCYSPLSDRFSINPHDVDVNYIMCAVRKET
jgi:2-polyprenyl-6-hydroxyphenyl methylase / 3-demethylubiquinone-9 3-methyltransferase